MSKVVLDSSALLALINNESGATRVEELLGNIVMSSVNVAEVASTLCAILDNEEELQLAIEPFIHSIIEFDKLQAYTTASLKNSTKHIGLSLGDRACIALGITLGLPIYTADKIWAELKLENTDIRLIR